MKRNLLSKNELAQIFAICIFVTHSWSMINLFRDVASWSLSLSIWDLLGSVSYTLISILFEALVVFLILLMIIWFLPKKWIGDRSVTISMMVLLVVATFSIVLKPYTEIGFTVETVKRFLFLMVALILISILLLRIKQADDLVKRIADPLTTLAFFYILIDFIGLVIVVIRNL